MANTTTARKSRSTERRSRGRQRPRSRRRARARRTAAPRGRREFREARRELGQARSDVRRAGTNVRRAGKNVLEAGEAGVSAARERVGEVAIDAGRAAVEVAEQLLHLPDLVREGARRSVELVETAGTRAVIGVIQAGTKVLGKAADYVSELTPRRRVQRQALERLVVEQICWVRAATEVYDRTVDETEDTGARMQLVRFKLETIKQAEALTELLREIGGTPPAEGDAPGLPTPATRNSGRAREATAVQQGLAQGLTIAVQSAERWRALDRIGALAEQDRLAEAILRATESVGSEPEGQVEFLRQALLERTVESVLA